MSRPRCGSAAGAGTSTSTAASTSRCRKRIPPRPGTGCAELERSDGILERDIALVDMRLADRLVRARRAGRDAQDPAQEGPQPGNNT